MRHMIIIVSLFVFVILVAVYKSMRFRNEQFFVAPAAATSPGCVSNADTLPAFVRPLTSITEPPVDVDARRAYHYDTRVETWERDIEQARRDFLDSPQKNRVRIDPSSYIKIDETQIPIDTLKSIGDRILHMMRAEHSHSTALMQVTGAWRPLQPDCFDTVLVTFVHCALAEGKRIGLCTSGSAVIHTDKDDVTFVNLQSAGVASEGDLFLNN